MEGITPEKVSVRQAREACIESFATYCRLMQDDGYFDATHEKLCIWTQAHIERLEIQVEVHGTCNGKLAYVMPRGSLKSTIVTKHLNTWLTLRQFYKFKYDGYRTLLAGNTHTNSKKKLQGIRGMFDTVELFKALFPEVLPKKSRHKSGSTWSDEAACINRKSSFDEATFEVGSLNTKLTGRHYNTICEDDTTAPDADEMSKDMTRPSTETIEKAIGFHQASMPLFVPKGFRLSIVVSTRWAMFDLIQHVQDTEDYHTFDVPAEIDGVPVFDCFYDQETLAIIKKRVGDYMYSMLYLNKPLDDSLRVFKSTDMQWVDRKQVPSVGKFTIAVDPAISEKDEACESAVTVNLHTLSKKEVHEWWFEDMHGHILPFALAENILKLADKYDTPSTPVVALIIEQEAYQAALKYILINMMNKRRDNGEKTYNIVKARRGNKEVRIEGMQPQFQQRRIHFVKGALSDQTESQLLQWPSGKLVDIIDSWSMHRKVWRSDDWEAPKMPEAEYVEDFETVLQELKDRRERDMSYRNSGLYQHNTPEWQGMGRQAIYH
jgi:hypothetical protein